MHESLVGFGEGKRKMGTVLVPNYSVEKLTYMVTRCQK